MYCFVILLLFNEMQMSVRRFSAIPHLRVETLPSVFVASLPGSVLASLEATYEYGSLQSLTVLNPDDCKP